VQEAHIYAWCVKDERKRELNQQFATEWLVRHGDANSVFGDCVEAMASASRHVLGKNTIPATALCGRR
jgi:hypothetical protein